MNKIIALSVMIAGVYEFIGLFTIARDMNAIEDSKGISDFPEWGAMTKKQKNVILTVLVKLPCEALEIVSLLAGALILPAPLKWALLSVAIPLPAFSFLVAKIFPRPVVLAWMFVDHVICTAIMIGGPVYFLR